MQDEERKPLQQFEIEEEEKEPAVNYEGEYFNLALLLVLYILQGIPLGMSASLNLILKERNVSYTALGTFSFASWPFSLKLLWAPLVDSVYVERWGRRKTWLVPAQILIGLTLLVAGGKAHDLVYAETPDVPALTGIFFWLYFLCATQDVAVDGWGLTMLRPENATLAPTMNAIGQSLGFVISFLGFSALNAYDMCTLSSFMFYFGIVFLVVTVVVTIVKKEEDARPDEVVDDWKQVYGHVGKVLMLKPIQTTILILLTTKFAFAPADSLALLQLQDRGLPKQELAFIGSVLMPVDVIVAALVPGVMNRLRPFDLYMKLYVPRLLIGVAAWMTVMFTTLPVTLFGYAGIFATVLIRSCSSTAMFVSMMTMFARVSDKRIGGTYMTLLNTIANLGGNLAQSSALFSVEYMDIPGVASGYTVQTFLAVIVGTGWFLSMRGVVDRLQSLPLSDWHLARKANGAAE